MNEDVLKLIKPEVLALDGYHVAIPPHAIKLNQNESPWDLPDAIKKALLDRLRSAAWSRYPSQIPEELHAELRKALELPAEIDILVGNGSNELIQTLLMASVDRGTGVVIPVPTFAVWLSGERGVGRPHFTTLAKLGNLFGVGIVHLRETDPAALAAAFEQFFVDNAEYLAGLSESLGMSLADSLMPIIMASPAEGIENFFNTIVGMLGVTTLEGVLEGGIDFSALFDALGL